MCVCVCVSVCVCVCVCVCVAYIATITPISPLSAALTVMFQPADYEVPEGDTEELILVTNRPYSFPFTINVTTQDGSAVCKCQCKLL